MKKYTDTGKKDTRSGFGEGLYEAAVNNPDIVAMAADLTSSVKMDKFCKAFPERFFQCGIAEANMIGAAAGMALTGKTVFAGSFAEFVTGRVYDQVRQELAYGEANVKIAASHAGVTHRAHEGTPGNGRHKPVRLQPDQGGDDRGGRI